MAKREDVSVEWETKFSKHEATIDSDGDLYVFREPRSLGSCEDDVHIYVPKGKVEELFGFRKREAEAVRKDREPKLGCATTEELFAELHARAEMDGSLKYRTIDPDG